MGPVSIQVNTRNITLFRIANAALMALEEKGRPIIVLRVGTILSRQDEIGILIRLCLRSLDVMTGRLDVPWRWKHEAITIVAVEREVRGAVFERCRALP